MKSKLKQLAVAGLTALALTYGCSHVTHISQQTSVINHCKDAKKLEEVVLLESSKHQVVMFGEQHGSYRSDNDFVVRLLPKLKSQGFNYLALEFERNPYRKDEIFADYISGKLSRTDITPENIAKLEWVYIKGETMETIRIVPYPDLIPDIEGWLDIIDTARKESMKIICYDANRSEAKSWNKREELAYKNIKEFIFEKNPDAKVVVYCGAAHLDDKEAYNPYAKSFESNNTNGSESGKKHKNLAYHLKEHTNGRTLTVSLVGKAAYIEHCDMIIDLDKNKCLKNKPYNKEE